MPVYNSMRFLPHVIAQLLAAGRRRRHVEFIFVDNGSSDGSDAYLRGLGEDTQVLSKPGVSISALRNFAVGFARGDYVSFLDSDCLIDDAYFDAALDDIRESGACATGHEYDLPEQSGWIELVWHELHYRSHAQDVQYLNGGNFFVKRTAFQLVGGFREDLWTGEDAELGQRLNAARERIHANPKVRAVHLGNPKTLLQFFRRQAWHGVGMFGTVGMRGVDRPTAMLAIHIATTITGVVLLIVSSLPLYTRIPLTIGSQLVVPATTVAYRLIGRRTWRSVLPGTFLYWLYYWARIMALGIIVTGRAQRWHK